MLKTGKHEKHHDQCSFNIDKNDIRREQNKVELILLWR
jgi:hypothetical protein